MIHNKPSQELPELGYDGRPVHIWPIKSRRWKRVPFNYVMYRKEKIDTSDDMWEYVDSFVDMRDVESETQQRTPRFLYRVYSSRSAGINTPEIFRSQAMKKGPNERMEELSEDHIHKNLHGHMMRRRGGVSKPSYLFHIFTNICHA